MSTPASAHVLDWVFRLQTRGIPPAELLRFEPVQQDEEEMSRREKLNLEVLRLLRELDSVTVSTGTASATGSLQRFPFVVPENPHATGTRERTLLHEYEQTVGRLHRPKVEEAELSYRDRLTIEFHSLVSQWEKETSFHSSLGVRFNHPSYVRIIGMGREALPLVFSELSRKPGHWFYALTNIVGKDVAAEAGAKTFAEATDVWLKWGKDHNYI